MVWLYDCIKDEAALSMFVIESIEVQYFGVTSTLMATRREFYFPFNHRVFSFQADQLKDLNKICWNKKIGVI